MSLWSLPLPARSRNSRKEIKQPARKLFSCNAVHLTSSPVLPLRSSPALQLIHYPRAHLHQPIAMPEQLPQLTIFRLDAPRAEGYFRAAASARLGHPRGWSLACGLAWSHGLWIGDAAEICARGSAAPRQVSPARNPCVEKASYQRRSLACHLRACGSPASRPKSNREKGFRESRRRRSAARFLLSCSPMAPIIARTRGGSEAATRSRRSKRAFSNKSLTVRRTVSSGESSLVLPARRRKSSSAASLSERLAHASGLRV